MNILPLYFDIPFATNKDVSVSKNKAIPNRVHSNI